MKKGLLAVCGSKKSGKSTSVSIIKKILSGNVNELAIADHLKNSSAEVFGIPLNYFHDQDYKEKELENYIVLTDKNVRALIGKFSEVIETGQITDSLVRPHVSKVLTTPRQVLQYMGTEVLHKIDPLIHVKILEKLLDKDKLNIVSDLRFNSEFNHFSDSNLLENFISLCIENHVAEAAAMTDNHASEREFFQFKNKCSYIITNNKSLAELEDDLRSFLMVKVL